MDPYLGYQINLAEATDFAYNDDAGLGREVIPSVKVVDHGIFDVNPHDYEFNGSITTALYINNNRVDSDDYILVAFDDDKCIGYTSDLEFVDGNKIYPLMIYNNDVKSSIDLQVYQISTDEYFDIEDSFDFTSDIHYGDWFEPTMMRVNVGPKEYKLNND